LVNCNEDPVPVPNRFYTMVQRPDEEWEPLVEVSHRYVVVPHLDMIGSFVEHAYDPLSEIFGDMIFDIKYSQNGGRMFMDIKLPKSKLTVNGDEVAPELRFGNSVDLTKCIQADYRAKRPKCENGMYVPDSRFPSGSKRTRHMGEDAEIGTFLQEAIGEAGGLVDAIKQWDKWAKAKISSLEFTDICEKIGFSPDQTEKIICADLIGFKMMGKQAPALAHHFAGGKDSNYWYAYNAVTQFLTHQVKNIATQDARDKKAANIFELSYNS